LNLNTNSDKLVELVISLHDQGVIDESVIIEKLESEFSFSNSDAETVLELVQTGLFRASFIAGGQIYPKNNLSDNPIVDAATKIGLTKLGHAESYKSSIVIKRPWWKLW
jgi:hypothetical protein